VIIFVNILLSLDRVLLSNYLLRSDVDLDRNLVDGFLLLLLLIWLNIDFDRYLIKLFLLIKEFIILFLQLS